MTTDTAPADAPSDADILDALAGCWCEDRAIVPVDASNSSDGHPVVEYLNGKWAHCVRCHEDYEEAGTVIDGKQVFGRCGCMNDFDYNVFNVFHVAHTMSKSKDMRLLRAKGRRALKP